MTVSRPIPNTAEPSPSLVRPTHVIYALHALSLVTGIIGAAAVVGAFLTGWPFIAVILNYVKRSEARGTWLESHFRWQIRTFWFGLLWATLCVLFVVVTLGIGILIAWLPLGVVGLWFIYRVAHGWLALDFAKGFMLTRESMRWFIAHYLAGNPDAVDSRVSPLRASSLAGVAPALVVTAGFDSLRDEGDAYARKLLEAGVRVDAICYGGMIHGFVPMGRLIETGNRAVGHIAATLRQALQPSA